MSSTPKKLNWKGAPAPERVTLKGAHVTVVPLNAAKHSKPLYELTRDPSEHFTYDYLPTGPFLTFAEFERFIAYFASDKRMQAYLFLALESLARPQELLYLRIRDVQFFDNYAKIYVSQHGKEGTKLIQCIDSFYYIQQWFCEHPNRKNKDAFLFTTNGGSG